MSENEQQPTEASRSTEDSEVLANREAGDKYREGIKDVADAPPEGTMSEDPEADDPTPAKLVAYYRHAIVRGEVGRSRTGIAARVEIDLNKTRKSPVSDERVQELVAKILA